MTSSGYWKKCQKNQPNNPSPNGHQIRPRNCSKLPSDLFDLWWENKFLLRLNATSLCQSLRARRISVTSVNVRRRADTQRRSEYRAAFDYTIDRRWSYIWFSVKWNVHMASSRSNIRLVVFIKTLFCLSYIIHAPTVKSDPRLAPLHKSDRIPYCQCLKILRRQIVQILGAWTPGYYVAYCRRLLFAP
jgi:hypothetical protein